MNCDGDAGDESRNGGGRGSESQPADGSGLAARRENTQRVDRSPGDAAFDLAHGPFPGCDRAVLPLRLVSSFIPSRLAVDFSAHSATMPR
jgi:hypothetical protein